MALDSFSNLKSAIADTLWRTDLTSVIPDFITLCEAEMNRRLRVSKMVGRATASVADEFVSVPTDFAGPRTMDLSADPVVHIQFVSPERALELKATECPGTGQPIYASVVGTDFRFVPVPDGTYTAELTYWQKITALSDSNTTNWILTNYPDAYLYGSLVHSAPYLKDDDRLPMWTAFFSNALDAIKADDSMISYAGRLNIRPKVFGR